MHPSNKSGTLLTMADIETTAEKLRRLIETKGMTSRALSIQAGLNETAVRDILQGKSKIPRIQTLSRIAVALDVPIKEILDESMAKRLRNEAIHQHGAGGFQNLIGDLMGDLERQLSKPETTSAKGDFRYAKFRSANLSGASMNGCDMRYADFTGADLTKADFSNADLRYANFTDSNMDGAKLVDADLREANFSGVDLTKVILQRKE